jgi:hypothetical protein
MSRYDEGSGFFDFLAEVPLFFKLFGGFLFILVFGVIIYVIITGVRAWSQNNASALLMRAAKVVDKRTEVWGGSGESSASTNYYITFELDDRTRVELPIRADKFGLIVVGDEGELTYQGTRFKEFNRK